MYKMCFKKQYNQPRRIEIKQHDGIKLLYLFLMVPTIKNG